MENHESLIRQAVNLRLKGNGKFWRQHNAESLLHCRCQWLSGRWNALVEEILTPMHISQLCLIFLWCTFRTISIDKKFIFLPIDLLNLIFFKSIFLCLI